MPLLNTETKKSVSAFIESITDEDRREDCKKLVKLFQRITSKKPVVWGNNFMIGFGKYSYKRKGGKEEFEWFNVGFAPRKDNITLYLMCDVSKEPLFKKLGKCKHGKGCIYVKKLSDIDLKVLEKMVDKYKDVKMGH